MRHIVMPCMCYIHLQCLLTLAFVSRLKRHLLKIIGTKDELSMFNEKYLPKINTLCSRWDKWLTSKKRFKPLIVSRNCAVTYKTQQINSYVTSKDFAQTKLYDVFRKVNISQLVQILSKIVSLIMFKILILCTVTVT